MSTATPPSVSPRRTGLETSLLVGLLLAAIGLGVMTEIRSAFQKRRKTDAGVFFRAGWAVRSGQDVYKIADNNDWHYLYPPLLAIAMMPLADPPADAMATARGVLPYAVSVGVWYALCVWFAWWATGHLAEALQRHATIAWIKDQPRHGQFWWLVRLTTLLFCLPAIGRALARGQVGTLLLMLLAGMVVSLMDRKSFKAGLWLAGAICLKVIPAFLLVYALWRRDFKMMLGCAVGLLLGIVVIPALVMGPTAMVHANRSLVEGVLLPGILGPGAEMQATEMQGIVQTDSNSIMAVLHNITHLDLPRNQRPKEAAGWVKITHVVAALVMTAVTLIASGWKNDLGRRDPLLIALTIGALVFVMNMASPVSHPHYYAVAPLLILPLLMLAWRTNPFPDTGWRWNLVLWSNLAVHSLTAGGIVLLRDTGLVLWGALALWIVACVNLWKWRTIISAGERGA